MCSSFCIGMSIFFLSLYSTRKRRWRKTMLIDWSKNKWWRYERTRFSRRRSIRIYTHAQLESIKAKNESTWTDAEQYLTSQKNLTVLSFTDEENLFRSTWIRLTDEEVMYQRCFFFLLLLLLFYWWRNDESQHTCAIRPVNNVSSFIWLMTVEIATV